MKLLEFAWRNLGRNLRRTALTVSVVAIGVAALSFAWALFDGTNAQMIENMTGSYTGHVQVRPQGYGDDPSIDRSFRQEDAAFAFSEAAAAGAGVTPRLEALSLLASDRNSRGLLLVGVDPVRETRVTRLHEKVVSGQYLQPGRQGGIVIGKPLAKALGVGLNDEVAVLTQGLHGSIGAARYHVHGIYDTGNEMVDSLQAFIAIDDANELLSAQGRITTLAMRLETHEQTGAFVQSLLPYAGAAFEVRGWKDLLPAVAQSIAFHEAVLFVVMVVLFGIVGIGAANVTMMSSLERVREFGTMAAVGTSPGGIFRVVLYEAVLIGLLGLLAGSLLAVALVGYFGHVGIDISGHAKAAQTAMRGLSQTLYPQLGADRVAVLALVVGAVAGLSALYPAWRMAALPARDALYGERESAGTPARRGSGRGLGLAGLVPLIGMRNLARHPWRTGLTAFVIVFGLGAYVFLAAFFNGYYAQAVNNSTGMVSGDAQVQHRDFLAKLDLASSLRSDDDYLRRLRALPGVAGASARMQTLSMVASAARAEAVMLVGVDPGEESQVTFLHRAVGEGRYLQSSDAQEIVLGRELAGLLNIQLGDRVVLTAQDLAGDLVSEAFTLVGTFDTGSHTFDKAVVHVGRASAQRMLGMQGRATGIALRVHDRGRLDEVLRRVEALLPADAGADARVVPWNELLPEVYQLSVIIDRSLMMVRGIVLLMIVVVVANTVLMSVLERTREFGVMLAVGSSPFLIRRLVLFESATIGLAGAVGGLLVGLGAAAATATGGISMKMRGVTAIPGVTDVIHPQASMAATVPPAALLVGLIVVAALYPAWRASRLQPVEAIRHA